LIAAGLSAAEIAARIHRWLPQVSKVVKEISRATKPTAVPVVISDSKTTCPAKTWDMLAAAARRRNAEPAVLLVQIAEGVIKHGSIDRAIHADAALGSTDVCGLRVLQIAIDLEAVGHAGGLDQLEYMIPVKARLKSARPDGERAG
jgi:hypothetical protein